jgi:hypothetical protein
MPGVASNYTLTESALAPPAAAAAAAGEQIVLSREEDHSLIYFAANRPTIQLGLIMRRGVAR